VSHFVDTLPDRLAAFGPVILRGMFGGHGVYYEGLMFGLVADDALWLKADAQTRATYEAAGCVPFVYDRKGKGVALSYYRAPTGMLRNPGMVMHWCALAFEAAQRARAGRRPKSRPRRRHSGA
jgi:DNA transformation protein